MQIAKSIAGFSGAKADDLRKAIGKKNREAMAKLKPEFVEGCRASGTSPSVDRVAVGDQREVGRLLVQQVARRLLRADRLPHGVAEGQLPGRVHGGADLLGDGHQGQGPVLRRRAARRWGSRSCRPTSTSPTTSSWSSRATSASGSTPSRASATPAVEAIKRAREEGGPFTSLWDFCERVDAPHGQQAVDRGADQVRRVRLHRRDAQGHARGARAGAGRRPEGAAGRADRPGLDLRPGRASAAAAPAPPARVHGPRTRRSRPRSSTSASCWRSRRSRSACSSPTHPLKEVREALRAKVDCSLAELPRPRDGEWVTVGGIITAGQEDPHRRPATPMMFATLDDLEGAVEILVFEKALRRVRGRARRRRDRARPRPRRPQGGGQDLRSIVQSVEPFEPDATRRSRRRARRRRVGRRARSRCASASTRAPAAGDDHRRPQARVRQPPGESRGRARDQHVQRPRTLRLGEAFRSPDAVAARRARAHPRPAPRWPSPPASA